MKKTNNYIGVGIFDKLREKSTQRVDDIEQTKIEYEMLLEKDKNYAEYRKKLDDQQKYDKKITEDFLKRLDMVDKDMK